MKKINDLKSDILFVDDFDSNLVLFKAHFNNDFNVFVANSGEKALDLLKQKNFAVLISDQGMPGMSGIELLEIVKIEYPDTLRFIITAYSDYETIIDSINKGEIYGFFNKPYDPKEVKISLIKAIEVHNLRISNKKMLEELVKVNCELQDIDRSKTIYLNNITNEIRSPINKIMSAVHMLKDRIGSNDLSELLFYLDTSVSCLESFSFAANQLARLNEENNSSFELKDVSLRELIELCILENKNLIDKFQTPVDLDVEIQDIKVKGEQDLLMTCFTTLLMNSLKHIERNGTITISCGASGEEKFLEIIDHGNIYGKNQIDNLINFFSENKKSNDYTPGIEMILAKQIMKSHNGKIIINLNEGKGVSIRMVFPMAKDEQLNSMLALKQ
jgi:signal transduction histidine kinase